MNFHVANTQYVCSPEACDPLVSVHGWPFYTRVSVSKTSCLSTQMQRD